MKQEQYVRRVGRLRGVLRLLPRGVARNLFRRGTKPGEGGQKSPSVVQGQNPGGGLEPPEVEDMLMTIAITR